MKNQFNIIVLLFITILKVFSINVCLGDKYVDYKNDILASFQQISQIEFNIIYIDYKERENTSKNLNLFPECHLFMMDPVYILNHKDKYLEISKYFDDINKEREAVTDGKIYKELVEEIKLESEKELYGIPWLMDFGILFYRSDILSQAPTSWDELIDVSVNLDVDISFSKYVGQFNHYQEYYYNHIEAMINNSDDVETQFYDDNTKEALSTYKELFDKEIIDENAWNQNELLGKNRFCDGKAIILRNWSSHFNNITMIAKAQNMQFSKTRIPIGKKKSGTSTTVVKGNYLIVNKEIQEDLLVDAIEVLKILTSREYQSILINTESFNDVPIYLSLLNENLGSPYCERIDCDFYIEISSNILTQPLKKYYKTNFDKRINKSYELIKNYFKNQIDDVMKDMEDIYKDKYIDWTDSEAIAIAIIAGIGAVLTLVVMVIIRRNRDSLVVRRSSPLFLLIMLVGIFISFVSIYLFIGKPTSAICLVRPFAIVLAFGLTFFSLLIKTFRIQIIFDKANIGVQDSNLLIYSGFLILFELILVGIWTAFSGMEPVIVDISLEMHYYTCKNVGNLGSIFQIILLVINGLTLVYGCYLAFKVKDVYTEYNESKVIGLSIYGVMICMIIQIIVSSNNGLGHSTIFTIQTLMIILSSIIILTFLFVPKFWKLHITALTNSTVSQERKTSKTSDASQVNSPRNQTSSQKDFTSPGTAYHTSMNSGNVNPTDAYAYSKPNMNNNNVINEDVESNYV